MHDRRTQISSCFLSKRLPLIFVHMDLKQATATATDGYPLHHTDTNLQRFKPSNPALVPAYTSPAGRDHSSWSHGLGQRDLRMFPMSDDGGAMKEILETHEPDPRHLEVKPLLRLVEEILNHATLHVDTIIKGTPAQLQLDELTHHKSFLMTLDYTNPAIEHIQCEMHCKTIDGSDAHAITLAIFRNPLSSYTWDAKLVLTLAAFALNYGEFWLLAQASTTNQLASSMAMLRQVPTILERSAPLRHWFEILNNLIKSSLDVTKCVVQFNDLPTMYITENMQPYSATKKLIPNAVYWTIRILVTCAVQIIALRSMGQEFAFATMEDWELRNLLQKLRTIHDHLQEKLNVCYQHIADRKDDEIYYMLMELMETIQIDNMKFFKLLISAKDDIQPLFDCSKRENVSLNVLRRKHVLLLISTLDISREELLILEQIYNDSRQHMMSPDSQYEVVWIPVIDHSSEWTDTLEKQFQELQSTMKWYTVHPSLIKKPVIRFIKDYWNFKAKPILVVTDPQGRDVNKNAMHMMWIWGANGFRFTSDKERSLWEKESWRLELLLEPIDPTIINWVNEGKYIFLYGGDDLEWVKKFTSTAQKVAQEGQFPLEMAYVGKSSRKDKVKLVMEAIHKDRSLGYCWPDHSLVWYFWTRLESMLFSKMQLKQGDDHEDQVAREIKRLLSHDKSGSWVLFSKGSRILIIANGDIALAALSNVKVERPDVDIPNEIWRLEEGTHSCVHFEFPENSLPAKTTETLKCPKCHRFMQKHLKFVCCHDEHEP